MKRDRKSHKAAFERLGNFVDKTHIVYENLSNINGDILLKAWIQNLRRWMEPILTQFDLQNFYWYSLVLIEDGQSSPLG